MRKFIPMLVLAGLVLAALVHGDPSELFRKGREEGQPQGPIGIRRP